MLSDDSKRSLLRLALVSEYGIEQDSPTPKNLKVVDVFPESLIYDIDGQLYEATYEIEGEAVVLGEPKKVTSTKMYKSMETLQTVYAEVIQEAGKRNALKDASRVKKILELCQELLSSEPDEEKAKEAIQEANAVLTLLQEQDPMRDEAGFKFPASAYAYVANAHKPGTWQLRMWEDLEKKVTKFQLGKLAAALSPGGDKGKKASIPADQLVAVKRKIKAAYQKLRVEEDDIPKWVKESESRSLLRSFISLTEAKFSKDRATVVVIAAGFNASKDRYYPAEMLSRDFGVFEGAKMYADHPTEAEDDERPERSIKDWVATLHDVTWNDAKQRVEGIAEVHKGWMQEMLASLSEKGMLNEMGISINAVGSASKAVIEDVETLVVEKLIQSRSVDFVTEPGAGGEVTLYESDPEQDIDLVGLQRLRERRPDLVKTIETAAIAEIQQEVQQKMTLEKRIEELEGENATLATERDDLKTKVEEADKEKVKAEAQAAIKEAVDKAELPQPAKDKLIATHKDDESAEGIAEAIQAEVDYIATLSESGVVRGLGPTSLTPEKETEALVESFEGMGLSKEEATVAARGR